MRLRKSGFWVLAAVAILVGTVAALGVSHSGAETGTPDAASPVPAGTPIGAWQDWQTIELTDARSGEKFTLALFYGQTVLVQPMATWCPTCRQQLKNIREALASEPGTKLVVIAISVETDLDPEDLAEYADEEEFDWLFAVSSPEMLRALVDEFGRALATPPSTPHFLLLPDGTFTDLETGTLSPEEVIEWFESTKEK